MTDDTMAFLHQIRERGGEDLLKDLAEAVLQKLMEFDIENRVAPGATSARTPARPNAMAIASAIWRRGSARWS